MPPSSQDSTISNKPVHVLHIASGDLWAGAEAMLLTLAKALHEKLDTQVSIVLLNHGVLEQKLLEQGIVVHVLDESRLNSYKILRQLKQIITDTCPDVIHTHRAKENILGSIAAFYGHRIPSLRTVHGAPEHKPPLHKLAKRLILFLDRLTGRYYQKYIIAVSADLAIKLTGTFPENKIRVIENGVDIEPAAKHPPAVPLEHSHQDSYRIGIAGRLVPVKRVDLFIKCALHLKKKHPELPIHYYIYGDGPLHDTLHTQVQSHDADDYIHFEGHCENITQQMQTLDALLMTSDHEGLPMILLEAMSLKTPIIAHAVGGIPHLLDDGRCGTLVYQQTPEAFAKAITQRLTEAERFQKLSQQAFDRVQQKYSAQHTATAYLKVYNEMTN